jgi:hypothetical protein
MALGKAIELKNGVTVSYWRITRAELDGLANTTKIRLSGYLSAASRNEGKHPITSYEYLWAGANNPVTPQVLMAGQAYMACYTKIKAEVPSIGGINPVLFGEASDV